MLVAALVVLVCSAGVLSKDDGNLGEVAGAATTRFDAWFTTKADVPAAIAYVPWYDPRVGTASSSHLVVPQRAFGSPRERVQERALIAALATLYVPASRGGGEDILTDGIRQYIALRAIHEQLVGAHSFEVRLFGGFASHVIRSVEMSRLPQNPQPPIRDLPELSADPTVRRIVDALYTLERYVGWPALQYVVSRWAQSTRTAADLDNLLWQATAQNFEWFTRAAMQNQAEYDYAVTELTTSGAGTEYQSQLLVARLGDGWFPVDVETIFADGTRLRERWDGRAANVTFAYRSRTRPVAAIVDPDRVLLLDNVRGNNSKVLEAPLHIDAVRWTLQWAIWLQDALLMTTALI